jgi:hypothetical protein
LVVVSVYRNMCSLGWWSGSSGRGPIYQAWGPEFIAHPHQKRKKGKKKEEKERKKEKKRKKLVFLLS